MKTRASTTAGVLTALTTAGTGVTSIFFGKKYLAETCKNSTDTLNSLINYALDHTVTLNKFDINFATPFPKKIPISTSLFIPMLNSSLPINTAIDLDLPSSMNISIGPISNSIAAFLSIVIGEEGINYLRTFSTQANDVCETYSSYALIVIGALTLTALLWQIGITFGFGIKFCSQDEDLKQINKELKKIKKQIPPTEVISDRKLTL